MTRREIQIAAIGILLLVVSVFLPNPVRGAIAVALCLGLPAWAGGTVASALITEVAVVTGAGVVYALVSWTLLSLLLLEVGVKPSAGVAVAEGIAFTVVPFAVRRGVRPRQQ